MYKKHGQNNLHSLNSEEVQCEVEEGMLSEDGFKIRKYVTEDNWQIAVKYPEERTPYDDAIKQDIKQTMEELTVNQMNRYLKKGDKL